MISQIVAVCLLFDRKHFTLANPAACIITRGKFVKQSEKNTVIALLVGTASVVGLGVFAEWLGPWWFWLMMWAGVCGGLIGELNKASADKKAIDEEDSDTGILPKQLFLFFKWRLESPYNSN